MSTNSIPQSAPPGSLTVTNPPNTVIPYLEIATNQLPVTFAWSFADVLSTPTSLTVSAVADNGMSFPVGSMTDGAVPGTATSVVWNLYSYDQAHPQSLLPNSTYRLQIADERGMGAGMTPGLLTPYNGSMFVIFSPAASATGSTFSSSTLYIR